MRILLAGLLALPALAQERPNVVMILADDLGYSCIGAFGSEIETPNLDALAFGGLRFEGFYNTARCWPTRAALMTGLWAQQTAPIIPMNADTRTIPELIGPAGYRTGLVGKWHLSEPLGGPGTPLERGFERFYGTIRGGGSYWMPDTLTRQDVRIDDEFPEGYYYTDAIGVEAAKQIEEFARSDAPFFQYVAFSAPHWPLHAPDGTIEKYLERYEVGWDELRRQRYARQVELGLVDPEVWPLPEREGRAGPWEEADHKAWRVRSMATYAAMVDHMDQAIGRVVDALKRTGRYENTLILFCADNGGCSEHLSGNGWGTAINVLAWAEEEGLRISMGDEYDVPTGGPLTFHSVRHEWANAQNTPLRRYKANVHEGGACSGGIAHWPRGIANAGAIVRTPVHVVDVAPTVYALAGATYPEGYPPLEGISLLPLLRGGDLAERPLFFDHAGTRAVRLGRWKVVQEGKRPWALYDLSTDRSETRDLSQAQPGRTEALVARWQAWHARVKR